MKRMKKKPNKQKKPCDDEALEQLVLIDDIEEELEDEGYFDAEI